MSNICKVDSFRLDSVLEMDDNIISQIHYTIHGYKLECVKKIIKNKKHQEKVQERWFCLKEAAGKDLPEYVRMGAKRTGFKTFNSFFAAMAYYRMPKNDIGFKF